MIPERQEGAYQLMCLTVQKISAKCASPYKRCTRKWIKYFDLRLGGMRRADRKNRGLRRLNPGESGLLRVEKALHVRSQ